MNISHILFLGLLCASSQAFAEGGCPEGLYPIGGGNGGWTSCAPIPGYGSSGPGQPSAQPPQVWSKRWGAIAADDKAGRLGGADGSSSKRQAEKAAIKECQNNGGGKCKVMVAYYNQCGALAWGDNYGTSARGPDRNDTMNNALASCGKETVNCKIYYAGCSYPARIR
jgi:hypothetical protein